MRTLVMAATLCSACATTKNTCPLGSNLATSHSPDGKAEYCTSSGATQVPPPARKYDATLKLAVPAASSRGVEGPYTLWYANGALQSHGAYVDEGARSVPDGVWGFWYPNGKRRTMGTYRRGVPEGCFVTWDADGTRHTGIVEGDTLHVKACEPPSDDVLLAAEGHVSLYDQAPAWADVSVQVLAGGGRYGARNAEQIDRDPGLRTSVALGARFRTGRFRFGPTGSLRLADNFDYSSYGAGGAFAIGLPTFHPRFDNEISVELGVRHINATAARPMQFGTDNLAFWDPIGAAQLGTAMLLTPNVALLVAARVEGSPTRAVERDVNYCDLTVGCFPTKHET
ncbi:MAG: hypothetical protein HOV81_06330, partial [Kofleriaceae bacterium]|nr:hypothetical protein [Kofleriaceae bacterium]